MIHASPVSSSSTGGSIGTGLLLCALISSAVLASCATIGHDFPVDRVKEIRLGQTTQEQIRSIFGSPWRVGIEDGRTTWTYGRYRYRLFGETQTQDLVVRFNDRNVVVSYTFNTTEHEE